MTNTTTGGGNAAPYLKIERLSKLFGSFAALKDVSLTIYPDRKSVV